MKTTKSMQKEYIEDIIAKEILKEELSSHEKRELDQWLKEQPENLEYYEKIKATSFSSRRYQTYSNIDADKAYRQFLKIQEKPIRKKSFWKYIAACLIPLFIIGGAIMLQPQKEKTKSAAIKPGTTQATLQLASGETINYDEEELAEASSSSSQESIITNAKGICIKPSKPTTDRTSTEQHNVLKTASNGEFIITLEDGTVVHLNYNTILRFPEHFASTERMVYLEGEAFFDVAQDVNRPFKVVTRDMTIKEYGTSFNVNTYSRKYTEVVLVKGSIGVINNEKEYPMNPNERLCLYNSNKQITIETTDVTPYIAWHKGRFIFDNESLGEIMETLSHWYDVKIVFSNPALKDLHFTGNMDRYGNLAPVLKSISMTVGLRIEVKNKTIYIYQ